jgi:hypothetical protein
LRDYNPYEPPAAIDGLSGKYSLTTSYLTGLRSYLFGSSGVLIGGEAFMMSPFGPTTVVSCLIAIAMGAGATLVFFRERRNHMKDHDGRVLLDKGMGIAGFAAASATLMLLDGPIIYPSFAPAIETLTQYLGSTFTSLLLGYRIVSLSLALLYPAVVINLNKFREVRRAAKAAAKKNDTASAVDTSAPDACASNK